MENNDQFENIEVVESIDNESIITIIDNVKSEIKNFNFEEYKNKLRHSFSIVKIIKF